MPIKRLHCVPDVLRDAFCARMRAVSATAPMRRDIVGKGLIYLPLQRRQQKTAPPAGHQKSSLALIQLRHAGSAEACCRKADAAQRRDLLRGMHTAAPKHARRRKQPRSEDVCCLLDRRITVGGLAIFKSAAVMQHDVSQLMRDGKPLPLRRAAGIIIKYDFTQSKTIVFGRVLG